MLVDINNCSGLLLHTAGENLRVRLQSHAFLDRIIDKLPGLEGTSFLSVPLFCFFLGRGMVEERVIGSLCACPGGSVQRL